MNIYITSKKENIEITQREILESLGNIIYIENISEIEDAAYFKDDEEKILALDPDYFNWKLENSYIDKIKNVKAICLNTTAYNWVDVEYCKRNGIIVTNVPKYSKVAVSEYVAFLMLSIARKLPLQIKSKFKCEYNQEMLMSNLENKTVGIIGLGIIGTEIANKCKGFGMNVVYWSKNSRNDDFIYLELEEVFKQSDFIVPTLVTNDDTKKIITDDFINSMKMSASFISIIPDNELYNHELIIKKVKNSELYGYGFENNDDDIGNYEGNIMVTPCYAWYTKEALENLIKIWIDSIKGVIENNIINNV